MVTGKYAHIQYFCHISMFCMWAYNYAVSGQRRIRYTGSLCIVRGAFFFRFARVSLFAVIVHFELIL